jgi:hypothetical protein
MQSSSVRVYVCLILAVLVLAASPASAQYQAPRLSDPATGEKYHIEASAGWWSPGAEMTVSSEALRIPGNTIDVKKDLGLTDQRFPEVQLVLRPGTAHKLRAQYIPIKYEMSATLPREIVFNGQKYTVGLPVNSSIDWKAARFAYEYDFIVRNRGFGGFIIEAKYTDVQVNLASPIRADFARARAPIPALGGIGRVYVVPNISITGEVTGFKLPTIEDKDTHLPRYSGHYVDVDIYGTINFNNYVGAQLGYRSLDVGYIVKDDSGDLTLKGLYFGAVVRY